ncbi:MAG: DUF2497 domain-containing protein [Holosporales bacterium]|jgi:cell pole-organizing protein PopZ|nr:DUF2497 domain-containing protein [Holosporales bacterium]
MNFPGSNRGSGSNSKRNDEMTMEDILSSIRKYVSEEESGKSGGSSETKESVPDTGQSPTDVNLDVINLGAGDIAGTSGSPASPETIQPIPSRNDSSRYIEQSELAEEVITVHSKRPGPFDKLTDALKSYGKPTSSGCGKTELEEMIFNFFRAIVEEKIDKWLEDNMLAIVEEAVLCEIERLKAEG